MANLNKSNTYYNGDVLAMLYTVLTTGFQTRDKGLLRVELGIDSKRALPKMSAADNPLGDYTDGAPSSETATVTYAERSLSVDNTMLYLEFNPLDFRELWPMFRSVGNLTNLALNPTILRAVLDVLGNKLGKQMDNLAWQGDTAAGGASALRFTDGFIKLLAADPNVVDVANQGTLTTEANWKAALQQCFLATPEQFLDDPDFVYAIKTSDYKVLQNINNDIQSGSGGKGILGNQINNLFLNNRIVHVPGMPANTIVGGKMSTGSDSNFLMGAWVDPDAEFGAAKIMLKENAGKIWFIRVDASVGFQYREGSEIILYQGV